MEIFAVFFGTGDICKFINRTFSFYSKANPARVPLSQQKEFKPVRNMVIREVVQMMEQLQSESVEYSDGRQQAVSELESASETSAPTATSNTPPRSEYHSPPPESVSACMISNNIDVYFLLMLSYISYISLQAALLT